MLLFPMVSMLLEMCVAMTQFPYILYDVVHMAFVNKHPKPVQLAPLSPAF